MSKAGLALQQKIRNTQVLELVLQGKSFREIADEMGITRQRAYDIYKIGLEATKVPDHTLQEWRQVVSSRLDYWLTKLAILIDAGDYRAIMAAVRIEERRAKMLGIDKPLKIDVTHHIPALDPEEAGKRQRARLAGAGFVRLVTQPPLLEAPADYEVVEDGAQ
jgi:hypothetical protein